jgi:hypothetical protein
MLPAKELSNIYSLNTNLVEFSSTLIIELHNQLQNAWSDLEEDLANLDTSNATDFIDELVNIITSDLAENNLKEPYQWGHEPAPETININLPFTQGQLLRLTNNAFASLSCDRRLSLDAQTRISKIYSSVKQVIELLFSNTPQPEQVEVADPDQASQRLHQMFEQSNRYAVVSLSDTRKVVSELLGICSELSDFNFEATLEANYFVTAWMDNIASYFAEEDCDFDTFLDNTDNGYTTLTIPYNLHESMSMTTGIFSRIIDTMQPTKREMSEIRSLETSLKQTLTEFHNCLTANEIREYASIR